MSINWVMLSPGSTPPYTPLPNEQTLFTSSPRIALSITTPGHFPGKQQQPFSVSCSSGLLYLTNRRIVFLPDKQTPTLNSFAAPILSLHDSHVTAPWFGPNVWTALLQPTPRGGIPIPATGVVEVRMTFKEGGAFDFHSKYEQVRERAQQAAEVARNDGAAAVHLEQLPAYQERGDGPLLPPVPLQQQQQIPAWRNGRASGESSSASGDSAVRDMGGRASGGVQSNTPAEPPPGYEEAVQAGRQDGNERVVASDEKSRGPPAS